MTRGLTMSGPKVKYAITKKQQTSQAETLVRGATRCAHAFVNIGPHRREVGFAVCEDKAKVRRHQIAPIAATLVTYAFDSYSFL